MRKSLGGGDCAPFDVEPSGLADAIEQRRFGGGHPHLAATFEAAEERCAAARIEVSGDFVEQQDCRRFAAFGYQFRVSQNKPEKQSLLFSCRGSGGRHMLGTVDDGEVLAMRANGCPSGCRVTDPTVAK